VALKSWSDITPENLREWLSRYPEGAARSEKLTSNYWITRARSALEIPARPPAAVASEVTFRRVT